ncbi:MFS transporter [Microbacterium sp. W1N]|uniref:MFS transporter n=1 Tax=Microbacterium festucae TaxID=2977531 RepID=UPI0021BE3ACC|nr:MFS transporter [Microbacterium festucae]MCT9819639.1 MFS transporter [Microbacterium festucae]
MSQSVEVAPRSLWHDRNFLTMWGGQALSQFGAQITELALPVLAVLLLHATEFEVGLLNAAATAAFLIVGLPAGAWIDRMRKRHVMIVADGIRAVALAMLPLLWWLGSLEVWHMLVVSLIMGVATVFFDVSYQSIVPSLVPARQIAEANGKLESTSQIAGIVGPAAGGWLIAVITAPFALLATAVTYVFSLVALSATRDAEVVAARGTHDPLVRSVREGLAWVFGNPYLRLIVGTTTVSNFFSTITFTLLPLFVLRTLGFGPELMGLIFAAGSVGGLVGAIATPHLARGIGEARAIPISAVGFSLVALLLPAAALVPSLAIPILIAQSFAGSFFVLVYNITQVTFRQRITPGRLLGRMNASIRFCVWGVMPIAALLAGVLGEALGVVPTMWIGAVGALASALFVVRRRFLTRDLPAAAGA